MKSLDRSSKNVKRRPDIFLSHSSDDKRFARRLSKELNRVGVDVWFDEWELEAGDSLHRRIGQALEKSRFVAVVISPSFLSSQWCEQELLQALAAETRRRTKMVIPVLCKKAVPPPFLQDRIYLDFSREYFKSLLRLGAIAHGISPKQIAEELENNPPKELLDVADTLDMLGWDGYEIVDGKDFEELKTVLKSKGLNISGDRFSTPPDFANYLKKLRTEPIIRKLFLDRRHVTV